MKMIVDIPDEIYKKYMVDRTKTTDVLHAVRHGKPLPEHHGKLIDANNLKQAFTSWSMVVQGLFNDDDIASIIDHAPTIIDAEGGNNVSV